jgi:hypothetical protein
MRPILCIFLHNSFARLDPALAQATVMSLSGDPSLHVFQLPRLRLVEIAYLDLSYTPDVTALCRASSPVLVHAFVSLNKLSLKRSQFF